MGYKVEYEKDNQLFSMTVAGSSLCDMCTELFYEGYRVTKVKRLSDRENPMWKIEHLNEGFLLMTIVIALTAEDALKEFRNQGYAGTILKVSEL